jgi:phage I-like protein
METEHIVSSGAYNNAVHEFQLFPYGESELEGPPAKKIIVDESSISSIVSEFKRRGNDLVVDYEHASLETEAAPAAGWISRLIDKGSEGLWAAVTWTEKAKNFLKNREYRYYSPVFYIRKSDNRVISILSVALTNTPRLNHLKPVSAKVRIAASMNKFPVMSPDMQRICELVGLELDDYAAAATVIHGETRLFETDEEKINRLLLDD